MWTIQYEFACYLMIAALGMVGLIRGAVLITLAAAMLGVAMFMPFGALGWTTQFQFFSAPPETLFQLGGVFLTGAAVHCYRDHIRFPPALMVGAAVALGVSALSARTALAGFCLFGAYLIFAVARRGAGTVLERINNPTDISYGVYLYAWPIEQLLIRHGGGANLLALAAQTWLLAMLAGWLSWTFVESPVLRLLRRRSFRARLVADHDEAVGIIDAGQGRRSLPDLARSDFPARP